MADDNLIPDLLPSSATALMRALSVSQARVLDVDMDVIRRAVLAHLSPASLLPWLAWDRSVDEYVDSWPEAVKRAVIFGSFPYHRTKGTPHALKRALAQIGHQTTVSEWFDYGGDPYRFRVRAVKQGGGSLTLPEWRALYRLILAAKNVRSHLDSLETATEDHTVAPRVACWMPRQKMTITIFPEPASP